MKLKSKLIALVLAVASISLPQIVIADTTPANNNFHTSLTPCQDECGGLGGLVSCDPNTNTGECAYGPTPDPHCDCSEASASQKAQGINWLVAPKNPVN